MNEIERLKQETVDDLYEIWNNLLDDMTMDFEDGESGYSTYKESQEAIKKYTLNVVEKKTKKWLKRIPIKSLVLEAKKEITKKSKNKVFVKDGNKVKGEK